MSSNTGDKKRELRRPQVTGYVIASPKYKHQVVEPRKKEDEEERLWRRYKYIDDTLD